MKPPLRHILPLLVVFLPLSVLCAAEHASVEERLNALEARITELAKENADLKKQLGWKDEKPGVVVVPAGKETRLAVGGFLQGQAEFGGVPDSRWNGQTGNDRFFFRRARIFVTGSFAEHFDFKAELDLQGNTLSGGTGHRAQGNEIYVGWNRYPEARVRFGQLKTAFGAEQLLSDTKLLTVERYLGSDRLSDGRQMAVSVFGDLPGKKVSYLVVAGNGNGSNVSANDDSRFQRSARVTFTPWSAKEGKLTLGANGFWSEDTAVSRSGLGFTGNTFAGRRHGAGLDAAFTWDRLDVSAEWLQMDYRPVNAVPDPRFEAEAWQATLAYYVLPAKLQAVLRHERLDPNSRRGGDIVESWLFGLNYYIKGDDLKMQLNYLRGDTPGAAGSQDRLLTRMQVMF
jgi:phosphate-selective porin OprO and OprP